MTRRAVWIAGVFCLLALGVAAWRMGAFRPEGPAPAQSNADAFPRPSAVQSLEVESAEGRLSLVREGVAWTMEWAGPGGPVRWPVDDEHVRAALRLLADAVDAGAGSGRAAETPTDLAVRLAHGGGTHEIRFGPVLAGGSCAMVVAPPVGESAILHATRELKEIFEPAAVRTWRAARALPDAALGVARIELETGAKRITLRQVGGTWSLMEPAPLAADADAVQRLGSVLASIPAERFDDELGAQSPEGGFDAPGATVVIERDERLTDGGTVRTRVIRSELRVGRLADLSGTAALCLARASRIEGGREQPLWGPVVIVVPTADLNRISPAPEAYVARRSWPWPASEVRMLAVSSEGPEGVAARVFERGPAGWRRADNRVDEPASASPDDEAALGALLTMLCETRAGAVLPGAQGGGVIWSHRVRATGLAGAVLGEARLGRTQGASPLLAVESGGVIRGYDIDPALARWLGW